MGLWLKCPGCNITNPLSLRVCPKCGRSLDNLSPAERVYVLGPATEATPAAHPAPRPEAAVPVAMAAHTAPKAPTVSVSKPKQPKKPRKKKG
ncbi:MAG: hypothetical protein NTW80_01040 [Deltaproteobacteria bacterium]|nr:hypothetical protein [Deltaproteobacteria bacterium]